MQTERPGTGEGRLLWSLLVTSLVLNALYAALAGVLVPALLAEADEASKETNLALVLTASSMLTLVLRPVIGSWTDHTRTRWGRRAPWLVAGAVASALAVLALGGADSVVAVGCGWLIAQPLLNVVEVALDAILPDRVRAADRARASARYGVGAALGLGVGAVLAGALIGAPLLLTAILGGILITTMTGFVVLNPDRSVPAHAKMPWRQAWTSNNLRLLFVGRMALVLGSQMVLGYLLYIVMDFTDRDAEEAARLVPLLVGVHLVALAIGGLLAVRWSRQRRVPAVLGASAVIALGLVLPIIWPSLVGLVAYAVVAGLGRGVYVTADLALMLDVLPSSGDHGRDVGLLGLSTVLPQLMAPAVAGLLLYLSGDAYLVIFVVAVALVLASVPFMARVRPL